MKLRYITSLLAAILLWSCSDDDVTTVDNPYVKFTKVGTDVELSDYEVECFPVTAMIDVNANVDWRLECDADWVKLSNFSGTPIDPDVEYQQVHIKLSINENTGDQPRKANIRLTGGGQTSVLTLTQLSEKDSSGTMTAAAVVNDIVAGWNMGNTLDAQGDWFDADNIVAWETCWGQPLATREMIHAFKEKGFNAIRVPVTWWGHLDSNGNVKEPWMARVEEVVNYVLDEGMYCIINVHHDTGTPGVGEAGWLCANPSKRDFILDRYSKLWHQIATRFADYDSKLIFGAFNEILDSRTNWDSTDDVNYEFVSELAQTFVNVVRSTGGHNVWRCLTIPTYAATHNARSLEAWSLPNDPTPRRIIAEVHMYSPWQFAGDSEDMSATEFTAAGRKEVDEIINRVATRFINQGIPVIFGELGAADKDNPDQRMAYADYVISHAKARGIKCLWWMGLLDRQNVSWYEPDLADTIINAANK